MLDAIDIKILELLQEDCTLPISEVGKAVGLSTTPCWRRIQKMEQDGVILKRVALVDPKAVASHVTVFVAIKAPKHSLQWQDQFKAAIKAFPEILEAYRMSGQADYMLRVCVADIAGYDEFYKALISRINLEEVTSSFAIEHIKYSTALPLRFAHTAGAKSSP